MTLTVGSLFTGIGGIDLGLERAGMRVIWQSEIEPYACRVLAKHWPHVPNLGDITSIEWSDVERPDLICGGYPCQPFSYAGVRRGETDPRHLWPHFAHAIRELRPKYALMENVAGHLSMGFGRVLGDLAEIGYRSEWDCIPASAVGAPHLRYRVFIVATHVHADSESKPGSTEHESAETHRRMVPDAARDGRTQETTERISLDPPRSPVVNTWLVSDVDTSRRHRRTRIERQTRRRESPYSRWWTTEPELGRVAHGIPHRVDRLRALGNAVVPQVAELIGTAILDTLQKQQPAADE